MSKAEILEDCFAGYLPKPEAMIDDPLQANSLLSQ